MSTMSMEPAAELGLRSRKVNKSTLASSPNLNPLENQRVFIISVTFYEFHYNFLEQETNQDSRSHYRDINIASFKIVGNITPIPLFLFGVLFYNL
ncbi:hypothetical protein IFR05_008800 [Cadophora sp. M221]|nr:hypothetical protein IFR05_008800 [Cadophora sp. M221]